MKSERHATPSQSHVVPMVAMSLLIWTIACAPCRIQVPTSLEAAQASYRANRDLASLQVLIGGLRINMAEEQVRALLGEPDYCPTEGQCYYSSNALDHHGFPMTLVVEYRYTDYSSGDLPIVHTHRLEEFSLSGIGE